MTKEYMDMLARYEEEQYRSTQTFYEPIFPTLESIKKLGSTFEHISSRN